MDSEFRKFGRLYYRDRVAFVHDCIEWDEGRGPAAYQDEVLAELEQFKREAVRGPHGLGKTTLASWLVLHFALTRDACGIDWKNPTTASGWRHLTKFLWPEIHKWARKLRWDRIGRQPFDERLELQQLNLKLMHGEAFAVASDRAELIEGAHADSLFYLFDEAKAIPAATYDAAEGAFSGAGADTNVEAFALAISTPGEPQGRFYDFHRRRPGYEDWHPRHVKLDEAVAAGRISRQWADRRAKQWGASSSVYQNRVLGEFAVQDESGVVPLAWIELANERWHEWQDAGAELGPLTALALDVADGGDDRSILVPRHGAVVPEIRDVTQPVAHATMALAGIVVGLCHNRRNVHAVVDSIGVGAGIVSRCREQEIPVFGFNAAAGTKKRDASGSFGFINKRSAAWWGFRERLDPETGDDLAIPPDDELIGDLMAPKWRTNSSGKIQVESKDESFPDSEGKKGPTIRQRLGRSTDKGDAMVMACWLDDEPETEKQEADAYRPSATAELAPAMLGPKAPESAGTQWRSIHGGMESLS